MLFSIGERQDVALGMIEKPKLTEPRITAVTMMAVIAQKSSEKPVTLSTVAEIVRVSVSYLEGLAADLLGGGLIKSFRGPTGGYILAKPADRITLLDIVLPIKSRPVKGGGKRAADAFKYPQVQALWDRMENLQYFIMQNVTLADVLDSDLDIHPCLNSILDRCEQA
jgi:Rrf2 family transcriptional regulator, iron-sulfur cluster assembly transcription factor